MGNEPRDDDRATAEIARYRQLAEAAYDAMYKVRLYSAKDCHDDAYLNFTRAIEVAERAGLIDEIRTLTQRRDHITAVFNSQFRGIA